MALLIFSGEESEVPARCTTSQQSQEQTSTCHNFCDKQPKLLEESGGSKSCPRAPPALPFLLFIGGQREDTVCLVATEGPSISLAPQRIPSCPGTGRGRVGGGEPA